MNSIFSNKNLLPQLKRRTRTRTKRDVTSLAKAKPLDILPDLAEEDETRWSTSSSSCSIPTYRTSCSIPVSGRPISEVKRDSRRVVLTGAEGLTFDDFFPLSNKPPRPAPAPPSRIESPLNEINLRFSGLGISMEFPSPPSASSCSSRRDQSPTPSESSSRTSASRSSTTSRKSASTPPTSEDESSHPRLSRSPTCRSKRASVVFMKSMPDLWSPEQASFAPEFDEEEADSSDSEDASWFAEDISDVVTLSSHLSPSFPSTPTGTGFDTKARPDSLPPPPRHIDARTVHSVPRISVQGSPSFQLDPTFVSHPYRRFIPNRPPPPPPILIQTCSSPTMEEKTEELLELLANAALSDEFLGTGLHLVPEPVSTPVTPSSAFAMTMSESARPPPRSAIPADIMDDMTFEGDDSSILDLTYYHSGNGEPMTPDSISVYSNAISGVPGSPLSSFDFEVQTPTTAAMNTTMLPTLPESPVAGMYSSDFASPPSTPPHSNAPHENPERTLRSRWSSSTLSSLDASRQTPPSASSWMLRFNLGGNSKSPKSSSTSHSKKPSVASKVPSSPTGKRSLDMERGLTRRESTTSRLSIDTASDSGDSTSSNGLRRKPIPLEIFLR
ncbi:hypothetical protein BXZ70DRAFT_954499 [Cristinia sonorae]|uniref:Uncharacterized protein n=1 Tax=Cristinia sonorae TaxID=1940300 RepID=A0A8K0UGQ6_9AGAR|nr:hypothetical protein BXZ70DRAFT_954499 [Cristinia sonorae]